MQEIMMKETMNEKKSGRFLFKEGKIYFSKKLERKLCFFMTMGMLVAGIFVKLGVF